MATPEAIEDRWARPGSVVQMAMTIGRNEPCPCGSGKKYKRCCLASEEAAARPPSQEWHELDYRLMLEIGQWAKRRFGQAWATCGADYPADFENQPEHFPLFMSWVNCERKIEGRPVASWYLEERGRNLMAHERDWLTAQLNSWLSVWEILAVEPGQSLRLKDLLTGEERTVTEAKASREVSVHLHVLARVVDHAGFSLLVGVHPNPLAPREGQAVVDQIRKDLGVTKRATPKELREGNLPTEMMGIWQDHVEEIANRPLPELRNTDGDELVLIKDHYKVVGKNARTTIEAEFAKMPDVQAPEPGEREHRYTVIQETTRSGAMESTIVASVVVKARSLVVEANSRERADVLRRRLEAAFGDIVRFAEREEELLRESLARSPRGEKKPTPALEGPEVDALLLDFKERHYATWADISLPALDGLTPREAAQQPKFRARVDTLLKDMELQESREEPGRRFDFGKIRRGLGLS
jgi:hypothetical protein